MLIFERGAVEVELTSPRLAGMTYFDRAATGPHEVALAVDADRFFAEYFGTTGGAA